MKQPHLLNQFGLERNPFIDRTAEKTILDETSLYKHSDLQGFRPSDTTYVYFGKRGSGKTTIRLMMQKIYNDYNNISHTNGHYLVDLCKPGHLTTCLRDFRESIKADDVNWDANFQQKWSCTDMVDCIVSYVVLDLVQKILEPGANGEAMLYKLMNNSKYAKQFLLLVYLYTKIDSNSLAYIKSKLTIKRISFNTVMQIAIPTVLIGTMSYAMQTQYGSDLSENIINIATKVIPSLKANAKLYGVITCVLTAGVIKTLYEYKKMMSIRRARKIQETIRVVKQKSPEIISQLLDEMFDGNDTVDTIQNMYIGISAHQKLELLTELLKILNYESLTIFGDCFDEVIYLDPIQYPCAIKTFAKEACRNDLLNFGRIHFFFPGSRLALDLSTDKTLKESRFDRHFVRELTWSRHQLGDIAERRFKAAQNSFKIQHSNKNTLNSDINNDISFFDLFKKVRGEDFSSYISKLSTPRELLIMMSEMFTRMEARPDGGLTSQDMEIAVTKALEQTV